MIKQEFSP